MEVCWIEPIWYEQRWSLLNFALNGRVQTLVVVHLKPQTKVVISIDLGCFWGPKMDCRLTVAFKSLDLEFSRKRYGFWNFIASNKKTPKHFSNLSSSNAHSINEHTKIDTCHKSMLSPNNLKLKLIIILENFKHLYSMVEMKTLKRAKLYLVIKS